MSHDWGCSADPFGRVPDDVLIADVLPELSPAELARACSVSRRFSRLAKAEDRWQLLFTERWGTHHTALHTAAARKAGGWRRLYGAKHTSDLAAAPYQKPCAFELAAAVDRISSHAAPDLCVCFLLDGSGSVHEKDFDVARAFIKDTAGACAKGAPGTKITVVQFSNSTKVEYAPAELDDTFGVAMDAMVRMNGGTNIGAAVQQAGKLFKADVGAESSRCVVLITDGRVDTYQAREARQMAERLADEQRNVSFYAFAVGRGVDKAELLHIIAANEGDSAEERYLDLCVRDEAPW